MPVEGESQAMPGAERREPLPETDEIGRLFGEYVDAADRGTPLDREALLARAGDQRSELAGRIRLYESLLPKDPTRLGRFEIQAKIGHGGLGRVYLAHDPELKRDVALKVLERGGNLGRLEREWVLNEARSIAKLEHPGVVRVFEVGEADGVAFLVMERLSGPSLAEVVAELRCRKNGSATPAPVTPRQHDTHRLADQLEPLPARVECLAKLADALAYCHSRGVLHRDVKPGNILFDKDGEPRLIDFGLAHLADSDNALDITQRLVGSPSYIAPEQVERDQTGNDPRSDQFVMGIVSYELLASETPFQRDTRSLTLTAIAEARPKRLRAEAPDVSASLERVVHHALERDPDERYPSVLAFAADLRALLEHRPVSVERRSAAGLARLWLRRHRRQVIATVAVAALFAIGISALRLAEERAERVAIVQAWEGWIPAEVVSPAELLERGEALRMHLANAARFDREAIFGRLLGSLEPLAHEETTAWSKRVRAVADDAKFDAPERLITLQSTAWKSVFDVEQTLLPDRADAQGYWRRGRVFFHAPPELDLTLLEQTPLGTEELSIVRWYSEIDVLDALVPSLYRVVATRPGTRDVIMEAEFLVEEPWGGPLDLVLLPPDEEHFTSALEFQETELHSAGKTIRVPPFRLTTSLVTAGLDGVPIYEFQLALEFARRAGGRLPTSTELRIAYKRGLPVEAGALGEWVSDIQLGLPMFVSYDCIADFIHAELGDTSCIIRGAADASFHTDGSYVLFRVVHSLRLGFGAGGAGSR